jgi:homoserine dehydrogenase
MEQRLSLSDLRDRVTDRPGVWAQFAGELGRYGISIASMLQKGRREGQTVPIVIKTHMATERDVQTALSHINRLSFMSEPTTLIRIEGKDE